MKRNFSRAGNQGGQVIIEYILMMVVVLTMSFLLQKWLRDTAFIQNFTIQPWGRLNGMIQCGAWSPCGVELKKKGLHPNAAERVLSLEPSNL